MKKKIFAFLLAFIAGTCSNAHATITLTALSTFGTGGWLNNTTGLTTSGDFQRGMTYSPIRDEVYVVDRSGGATNVRVFDGTTGAAKPAVNVTGVTGGTLAANMIGIGSDGVLYMANLSGSTTGDFKVYRWSDTALAPSVAFNSANNTPIAGTGYSRTGDSFAVFGSGANTRIISSGGGGTPSIGILVLDTTDGVTFTQQAANPVVGTPTIANGSYRLGLDFVDANTAIGKQTGTPFFTASLPTEGSTPVSTSGTTFSTGLLNPNETPLAFYNDGSIQRLATIQTTGGATTNTVRLYDASNLSSLTFLSSLNNTTGAAATNGNATGDLAFGLMPNGDLRLYALNTNNGIQAFTAVPEPSSIALVTLGAVGIVARRRQLAGRKQVS
jgi:hypothetical protein